MIKLLFVDDDYTALKSTIELLNKKYSYEINWLTDAKEVLSTLENNSYDAIVLDIMMTVPDFWLPEEIRKAEQGLSTGIILMKKIRSKFPTIPIIIYSAKNVTFLDKHSTFIGKPESTDVINNTILNLISNEK